MDRAIEVILDRVMLYAILFMNRDLNLAKEKRFSFIQTITIYPHRDNNELYHNSLVDERISVAEIEENKQEVSSSALCTQDDIANDSTLNTNSTSIPSTVSNCWYPFNSDREIASVIYVPEFETNLDTDKNSSKKSTFNRYIDRILLIFASGYLCFIFWWLFASKNALFPLAFLSSQTTISQADAEFIDYMKQSLEVIDRVAIKQSSTETTASNEISEVTYVPVYTPNYEVKTSKIDNSQPNIQLPPPPPPNNLAALTPPISTIKIQPPIPPSESVEVKTTPAESSSENAATPITKSTPETNTSDEVAATNIKPSIEHTLVGLMELKEGSAALFKISGVTQRIWLGEEIENSGWILDSVANQKAKINYGEKTLTLRVGESFKSND